MSGGGTYLKDEVRSQESVDWTIAELEAQGSRVQVVLAGGVAGLVSRLVQPISIKDHHH